MLRTRFTDLLGCSVPIQSAPMGGLSTPDLVVAVADAGGVGMLGVQGMPAPALSRLLDGVAARTSGAWGVTFLMPFFDPTCLPIAVSKAPLVDFYYGDPDPALVDAVHAQGKLASWQVGSVAEAEAAATAGCDLLTVQGAEAGGRLRAVASLLPLLSGVLDAVDLPVVAAGGIGGPREMAAALAAGADAVRMGTRFLATPESGAHPDYVDALVAAGPEDAVVTDAFSVMWPRGPEPSRVLRQSLEAAHAHQGDVVGEASMGPDRVPVPTFAVLPPGREATGDVAAMAHYAGQSVGAIHDVRPAADVVRQTAEAAEALLRARLSALA